MTRSDRKLPTDAELRILGVLWERGPSTVRQVHLSINESKKAGYTTVLKLMQIMTEKGLLLRDVTVRPQVYRAARSRAETQGSLIGDLLDRAFSGSAGNLVLRALSTKRATAEERARIRELLERLEEESK